MLTVEVVVVLLLLLLLRGPVKPTHTSPKSAPLRPPSLLLLLLPSPDVASEGDKCCRHLLYTWDDGVDRSIDNHADESEHADGDGVREELWVMEG